MAVLGAGAKGVTLLNLVDPSGARVDCVVDVNPKKQGRFLAGTGQAIVAPAALAERGVRHVLVLNPNYTDEIRRQASLVSPTVQVHDAGVPLA